MEYFQAAAEYYQISAEIVSLLEDANPSIEIQDQILELERRQLLLSHTMDEYVGISMEGYNNKALLRYPRLTKHETKRKLEAKEHISSMRSSIIQETLLFFSSALLAQFAMHLYARSSPNWWISFWNTLGAIGGAVVINALFAYLLSIPLDRKASKMEFQMLSDQELFIKRFKYYRWLIIIASIVVGLAVGSWLI